MVEAPRTARLVAEFAGTAMLLATVVGSGIMAEDFAGGNVALALLGNTIATGAILIVLIMVFGPVSGAHFNPAVTLAFLLRRQISPALSTAYVFAQVAGAIAGVWLAHGMFDEALLQTGIKHRSSPGQWLAETVATFGLVLAILGTLHYGTRTVAASVGLYITAAYWFTASTSFANPAVTAGRTLTASFSGILPAHAPVFVICQLLGAVLAVSFAAYVFRGLKSPG